MNLNCYFHFILVDRVLKAAIVNVAVIVTVGRSVQVLRHMRTADIAASIAEGLLVMAKQFGYQTPAMDAGEEPTPRIDAMTRFDRSLDHFPECKSSFN